MNNFMIDPVTGQPLQKMQPQLDPMTGMPVQPVAEQIPMPNQAVYGKQRPMQVAENVFGTSQMRQQSVMMVGDLDNDRVMSDYETTRHNAIKEAIAKQK